jgi:putative SOS response-associated peptidase YedK
MCGRYVTPDEAALERFWNLDRRTWNPLRARFNVAPTTAVPIIRRADDGAHELCAARWGLVPHWWSKAKPPTLTFNARSEDAAVKPMWRHAYRHERCLMPARGWYEWRQRTSAGNGGPPTGKQPYFIHCEASPVIAFAGLMAHWRGPDGQVVVSCALLSRAAAPSIAEIHDRMPVVLPPDAFEPWLAPELSAEDVGSLVAGARSDFLGYPVSTRVNDTRNDAPELLDAISGAP